MSNDNSRYCENRGMIANQKSLLISGCSKLATYNWMEDIPLVSAFLDVAEVRFKNTRKGIYRNVNGLRLSRGDIVAVEASPGHDIGIVSLTGELVIRQMKKNGLSLDPEELRKIYRKAKPVDTDKWKEAISLEDSTMIRTRKVRKEMEIEY